MKGRRMRQRGRRRRRGLRLAAPDRWPHAAPVNEGNSRRLTLDRDGAFLFALFTVVASRRILFRTYPRRLFLSSRVSFSFRFSLFPFFFVSRLFYLQSFRTPLALRISINGPIEPLFLIATSIIVIRLMTVEVVKQPFGAYERLLRIL